MPVFANKKHFYRPELQSLNPKLPSPNPMAIKTHFSKNNAKTIFFAIFVWPIRKRFMGQLLHNQAFQVFFFVDFLQLILYINTGPS